jgi:hypothetical protein
MTGKARETEFDYRAGAHQLTDEFVLDSVILQTEWVLRDSCDFPAEEVCRAFRLFFGPKNVVLAGSEKVARILDWHEAGLDFEDAFHLAESRNLGCIEPLDKIYAKQAKEIPVPYLAKYRKSEHLRTQVCPG